MDEMEIDNNEFIDGLKEDLNYTETENGAMTLKSTESALLDFYSKGAALRQLLRSGWEQAEKLFSLAWAEDHTLALKCLFYFRDIRAGQGERETFRRLYSFIACHYDPENILNSMRYVPAFGRWDDLFCLVGTPCEDAALQFIRRQLIEDIQILTGAVIESDGHRLGAFHPAKPASKRVSLLAKWLPSENTSSDATRNLATKLRIFLNKTSKEYRQILSSLRKEIRIVERDMCANRWSDINYEHIPSRASMIYRNAFHKHDAKRYSEYLSKVESGEAAIKADALYPYDIVRAIRCANKDSARTLDAQWKALPDYLADNPHHALCVCDVSGSMSGLPLDVSVSLGIYFAERNQGAFHNTFITFSGNPSLQQLHGDTLQDKVRNLEDADWEMNTNLQKVFDVVLSTAVGHQVPQEHMPNRLYIISDMQFDVACDNQKTNFEAIKDKYSAAGYNMPELVFWNVAVRPEKGTPVARDERGTYLVSGCSPVILKYLLSNAVTTPYDSMMDVLMNDRYAVIQAI